MTSPFSFKQVFLGFQRGLEPRPKAQTTAAEVIQTGDFRINLQSRKVSVRRKEVQLTQEELDLLVFLTTHPKKVITPNTRLVTGARDHGVRRTQFLHVLLQLCRKVGGLIADLVMAIVLLPTVYVWVARPGDVLPEPAEAAEV